MQARARRNARAVSTRREMPTILGRPCWSDMGETCSQPCRRSRDHAISETLALMTAFGSCETDRDRPTPAVASRALLQPSPARSTTTVIAAMAKSPRLRANSSTAYPAEAECKGKPHLD